MIKSNRIYCGDCVQLMKRMQAESVDLVVTSPPYDDLRTYRKYNFDFKNIALQLYRVIKPGGVVVWVVGDATVDGSETGTSFAQALFFKNEVGFRLHDTMIYEKTGFSFPSNNRYHQMFEYMFVLSKGKPKTFNPIKDHKNKYTGQWGKNSVRNKDGTLSVRGNKRIYGKWGMRANVWRMCNGKGFGTRDAFALKHPATFPERLAEDHVLSWTDKGDTVLDPMCGSGTTLKMALLLDRKYIGMDVSNYYCGLSEKRVRVARRSTMTKEERIDELYRKLIIEGGDTL